MEFKDILQKIRKDKKISQEDLAQQLGISRQAVAKWETGATFPDIDNLIRISEIFCVTIDYLVKSNAKCSNQSPISQNVNNNEILVFCWRLTKKHMLEKERKKKNLLVLIHTI